MVVCGGVAGQHSPAAFGSEMATNRKICCMSALMFEYDVMRRSYGLRYLRVNMSFA